jgi:hypothetical protein
LLKESNPDVLTFLKMSADLGLGIWEKEKIELKIFELT